MKLNLPQRLAAATIALTACAEPRKIVDFPAGSTEGKAPEAVQTSENIREQCAEIRRNMQKGFNNFTDSAGMMMDSWGRAPSTQKMTA